MGAELVFRAAHQIAGGELCGDTLGDAGVQLIVLSPPFRQRVAQIGSCTILRNGQVHPAQPHTMQGPGARTVPIGAGGLGPCVLHPAQLPGQLGLQVPLDPLRNRFQSSLRQSASGGCFLVSRRVCPALSGGLLLVQGDLSAPRSYRAGAGPLFLPQYPRHFHPLLISIYTHYAALPSRLGPICCAVSTRCAGISAKSWCACPTTTGGAPALAPPSAKSAGRSRCYGWAIYTCPRVRLKPGPSGGPSAHESFSPSRADGLARQTLRHTARSVGQPPGYLDHRMIVDCPRGHDRETAASPVQTAPQIK